MQRKKLRCMTVLFVENYFCTNLPFFYTRFLIQGRNPTNVINVASLFDTNIAFGPTRGASTPLQSLRKNSVNVKYVVKLMHTRVLFNTT
jgi:hypothetical protein